VSSSAEERIALTSLSCWTSDLPLSIISNQDRIQISKTLQKMKEDRFWLKDSNRQFLLEREIKIEKSCKKNPLHKINISSKFSSDFFIFDVQCGDVADCQI